jgi:hypothetical protein
VRVGSYRLLVFDDLQGGSDDDENRARRGGRWRFVVIDVYRKP